MKQYQKPAAAVVLFETEDLLSASSPTTLEDAIKDATGTDATKTEAVDVGKWLKEQVGA